jgi:parallel beta-helix repeat protein
VKVAAGDYQENVTTSVKTVLRGGYDVSFSEATRAFVGNKTIFRPTTGTALSDGRSSTIDGFVFDGTGGASTGIAVTAGHAIIMRNVVFGISANFGKCFYVLTTASATIQNNTVANNKLSGGGTMVYSIYVTGNADGATGVLNNIAFNNNVGISIGTTLGVISGYNCSFGNSYRNFDGAAASATDFSNDPNFRGAAANDYRLSASSPCIDAGDPSGPLDPDGTRADIGAYYFPSVISIPATPSLSSPSHGSTSQPLTTTMTWGASAGATKYHLQVSTSLGFSNFVVDDSTLGGISRSVGPLASGTTHYWRVRAGNSAGWSSFSASWSFTTTTAVVGQSYYADAINGNNTPGAGTAASPWKTITYALNQISGTGNTLNVAAGTYNTGLGETFPIMIKSGVSLSGAGIDESVLDAQGTNTVVKAVGISDATTTVRGFTIQGGGNSNQGGGLFISAGSVLTVDGCKITANTVSSATAAKRYGGGIYILSSSPIISNCEISGNVVMATRAPTDPSDFGAYGGGIAISGTSSPQITQNTIRDNEAQNSFFALACGAGIYVVGPATPRIEGNSITGNTLHRLYATSGPTLGAGIYVEDANGVVTKNTIADNGMTADYGSLTASSGIYIAGLSSKPKVTRNIVARNADHGIWCREFAAPSIVNNTIAENTNDGIYLSSASPDSIVNNIFALNSNYGIEESDALSDPGKVLYNLFYANSSGLYRDEASTDYFSASLLNSGVPECKNNIDGDPAFVDLANGDYHLRFGSPAIDAGNPGSPLDPDGTRVDIGAFYYVPVASIPSAPSLSSPANNANLQPTTLSLSWGSSVGATRYHLQVSITASFSTFVVNDSSITGTSSSVGPLASGTVHYWRVRAGNSAGWSGFSAGWAFTTIGTAPSIPTLVSPSSGSSGVSISPILSWNAVNGAVSYALQVSTLSTFNTNIIDQTGIAATSFTASGLVTNTAYYWRVNATNPAGTSGWSSVWSFTTSASARLPGEYSTDASTVLLLHMNETSGSAASDASS